MKRKLLLFCLSLLVWAIDGFAQPSCPNPNQPAPPGSSCGTATFFCNGEIDGFCSTLPNGGADGPNPLCPGAGVPNNIHWMAFAAGSTDIVLRITPTNCAAGGQQGVQAGVYDDCDFQNSIDCEGNCQTAAFELNLTGLNIGQVYYLLIDGCAGNVCSYDLDVITGSTVAPAPQAPIFPIQGQSTVCVGLEDVSYSTPEVTFGTNYFWTVPPGATFTETNDLGNEISVDFGSSGGQICVSVGNDCYQDPDDLLGPICFPITMQATPTSSIQGTYCTGGCYFFAATGQCFEGSGPHQVILTNASFAGCDSIVNISLTTFTLPPFNLDLTYCVNEGCATYSGDGECYSDGTYSVTFFGASFQGCDSTVNLDVTELLNSEEFIEAAVCAGEEFEVCGIPYDFENQYEIDCNPNFVGCDSTIILDLYVLEPIAEVEPPALLGCGTNASIYLDAFSSFGDEFLWETVDGIICDDPTLLFLEVCAPGIYCLTATSIHNYNSGAQLACTDQICVTVMENAVPPNTNFTSTPAGCPGQSNGTATITVSNPAIGPFTYTWVPQVSISNTATNLGVGTYNVTITAQSNGCTSTEQIMISASPPITIGTSQTNVACNGGSTGTATATPGGGSGSYTYNWCNGQTSQTATGLPVGTCSVTVTSGGCTNTASVTITQATAMALSIVPANVACNGGTTGSATASASGGTGPYTYLWSNSQTGATATNLAAGSYTVTATDALGCTSVQNTTLVSPPAITLSTTQTNLLCNGDANGTATANPGGGVGGFTYNWCNGQTTATATGLPTGPCQVTVTDGNGCTAAATVTITAPNPVSVSATSTNVNCFGVSDGTATATVSGGTGSPSYQWCNGQSTATATGLGVGACGVTVTDGNGCTAVTSVTLTGPATALSVSGTSTNASCGSNNGTVSITVSGGTPSYTYAWSNSSTTQNITNVGPGGYTVTVTDNNDCTAVFSTTVNTPSGLQATTSATPVSCNGGSNGTVSVTVSGGSAPFSYAWTGGIPANQTTGTNLAAGNYNVTVTDGSGCTFVSSATVAQPTSITIAGNSTDENCGEGDGTISTNVQGGSGPYQYAWAPSGTGANPTGLSAGNYSLTVTDANSCTATFSIPVNTPGALLVNAVGTNADCNGEASGSIATTVTGGTGPYDYAWTGGLGGTEDPNNVAAGTYNLVVTDDTGCSVTTSVTIAQPTVLAATNISNQATCGDANGSINITVTGGTTPYSYDWSNNNTTSNPNNLTAGNYTVTIMDGNDCELIQSVIVTTPPALALTIASTMASCFGETDGSINLGVTGGTVPYIYAWTGGAIVQDPTNLAAGTYQVTVTDNNDCTETVSVQVGQPTLLNFQANSTSASCGQANGSISSLASGGTPGFTYAWSNGAGTNQNPNNLSPGSYVGTVTDANGCTATTTIAVLTPAGLSSNNAVTNVSCNGATNGAVNLEVAGGVPPFTYEWSTGATTQDLNNLAAGTYEVTITDDTGCEILASATVTEPDAIALSETIIEATCGDANGGISLTVVGGAAPYSYDWSNNTTNQNPTGLLAGDYDVIVTDANDCTATLSTTVTTPNALTATATQSNVSCNGGSDGSVNITVQGGTAPYTYLWNGSITTQDPMGLPAGVVTGVVTDANGCEANVTMTLQEPAAIVLDATTTDATCGEANGSINLTVSGGASPYTYNWDNAPDVQNPGAVLTGTYTVVVTDLNGCTESYTTVVNTPNALMLSAAVTDADCNGASTGSINLTVSGGVAPFTYDWPGWNGEDLADVAAGSYTVIVTDATDCSVSLTEIVNEPTAMALSGTSTVALCGQNNGTINLTVSGGTNPYTYEWSNGDINEDPINLGIGNYTVIVTDANQCTAVEAIVVSTPNGLALTASSTDVSCNGGADGTASVSPSGGTPPFTYLWSNGQTTPGISGLFIGTVTCTVTDSDGCEVVSSSVIAEPTQININGNSTQATCGNANGTVTIAVSGGTSPYTYAWSNGSTNQNPTQLLAGLVTVTVTDANSCMMEASFTVGTPLALSGALTPTNVSCFEGTDGSISPAIFGGVGPYDYLWTPGGSTMQIPTDLSAGVYTLLVTDANGCTLSLQQALSEPAALDVSGTSTNALCGESDGTVDITVTGGTTPYSYVWSNGPTTPDLPGVAAGSYTVTVTDANDCEFIYQIAVNTPSMLVASADGVDALCFGSSNGMASSTVTGGSAPFTYEWSNGDQTEDLLDVTAGNYILSVTDATGCTVTASVTIGQPTALSITGESTDALCNSPQGTVSISVTGGTLPYGYTWSNGATSQDIINLSADVYTVTVTDLNGCTATNTEVVSIPNAVQINSTVEDANCNDSADGSINIETIGGISPFTYEWSNGATTQDVSNLPAGDYVLTITDGNNCDVPFSITVEAPPVLTAEVLGATDLNCNGDNSGSIPLTVTGGTAPYSYDWDNAPDVQNPSGLAAGNYNVIVTDANGCTALASATLTQPDPLVLNSIISNALCSTTADGGINLSVSGGTAPFEYDWTNGSITEDVNDLTSGTYNVIVTDGNGCTESLAATVDAPEAVELSISALSDYNNFNLSCNNSSDGFATVQPNGGVPPYSYLWSNGDTNATAENLSAGTYTVVATDVNGCPGDEVLVTMEAPANIEITTTIQSVLCFGDNDGAIIVNAPTGGAAPYMYSLDGSDFNQFGLFGNLPAGSYELIVQDANGCESSATQTVSENGELQVIILGNDTVRLGGITDLEVQLNRDTSVLQQFGWTQGDFWYLGSLLGGGIADCIGDTCKMVYIRPLETTKYEYVVVDENGCIGRAELIVRVLKDRAVYIPTAFSPNGDGKNDLFQIYTGPEVADINFFKIYNRWGEVVYELNDLFATAPMLPEYGWDGRFKGKFLNPGVYVYHAEILFHDGRVELLKGDVTIMR